MPKKVTIKTPLTDVYGKWGDVYHEGEQQPFPDEVVLKNNQEWGHTRGDIEDVIKAKLRELGNKKIGFVLTSRDPMTKKVYIRFFADEESADEWQTDSDAHADLLLGETEVQESEAVQEYTLAVKVTSYPSQLQIAGSPNWFNFKFNSYWGGDPSDHDTKPGTLVMKVDGDIKAERTDLMDGGSYNLNVGQYCTKDSQTVTITISNGWANTQFFKTRTWEYTIEAITIGIAFDDSYVPYTAKGSNWELRLNSKGAAGKISVMIDDSILQTLDLPYGNTICSFMIDASGSLSTGRHKMEVWKKNETYNLETEHLITHFIKAGSSIALGLGLNPANKVALYDTVEIPYFFYYPNLTGNTDVHVKLFDGGTLISDVIQNVHVVNGNPESMQKAVVHLTDADYVNKNMLLEISIGAANVQHYIKVTEPSIYLQEATDYKVYYNLGSKSNNDNDVKAGAIVSTSNGQKSQLSLSSNFKLDGEYGFHDGGCVIPAQSTLTLAAVPGEADTGWKPFATDFGVNGTQQGKTIEMELSVGICADQDEPVVSCIEAGTCGFEVFPNRVEVLYGGADRIVTYFPDGKRVKFSLVINGTKTTCINDTGNGTATSVDRNLGFIYMNGVMVRIFDYGNHNWNQNTPKDIVFGSAEGTVTIHSIRGYDKSLAMHEVLGNYAYDTPVLEDKLAIATRNNILLSDGENIDRNKIAAALPHTPVITWYMNTLPANKEDPQRCESTEFVNPDWKEADGYARAPFTAGLHEINGDGTSSNDYPLPYKNWAEKYTGYNDEDIITLHVKEGEQSVDKLVKKYSITYGIDGGETKFVHKVNYASSEGIFNILAMNMYQQLTLAARVQITDLLSKQQQSQVDNMKDITFRKSLSGFPEIGFRKQLRNGQEVTTFLSIYNFINNKKTGSMFGMDGNYKHSQLWEIDGNRNFFMSFMTEHTFENDQIVESNGVRKNKPLYYARFPSKSVTGNDLGICTSTDNMGQANDEIRALRHIHNWIYSVNPNVAKQYAANHNGNYRTLDEPVTYGEGANAVTFTEDTPAYRRQKFMTEQADHLHLNDCIFYFVFCEWILGKDSMDKNMSLFLDDLDDFYSDDPTVRAQAKVKLRIMLRDTDTTNMFDNTGKLVYKYWHEWNDTYNQTDGTTHQITGVAANGDPVFEGGGEPVFNGRLSGLWDVIVEAYPDLVESVFKKMRAVGLTYAGMFGKYQELRNYWCEALYNVDGLGYANTGNLDMAYGDKLLLSEYFYKYRERYMNSKYRYIDTSKTVTMRFNGVPYGIWMKHFTPMYASFQYGGGNVVTARSINGGEACLRCNVESMSNEICYVDDADMVTEIGFYSMSGSIPVYHDLGYFKNFFFSTGDFSNFIRLKKFIWANTAGTGNTNTLQDDTNQQFNFGHMKLLEELVMTYCVNWHGNPVIGSNIIRKIDFRGTPIASITIPETDTLTELYLPASLTTLTLKNVPNLSTFEIDNIGELTEVHIENAGTASTELADALTELVRTDGVDALKLTKGKISIPNNSGFTGEEFQELKNALQSKLGYNPYIPTSDPEKLYVEVPQGIYLSADKYLTDDGETVQFHAERIPYSTTALTFEMIGGTYDENTGTYTSANGSELNATTGVLVTSRTASETISVKAVYSADEKSDIVTITSTKQIYPNTAIISGKELLNRKKEYTFTVSFDVQATAIPKKRSWEISGNPGFREYVEEVNSINNSFTLRVRKLDSNTIPVVLSFTAVYKNGTVVSGSMNLYVTIQVPEGAIDMGLPSGTLWAICDMDLNNPSKFADSPQNYHTTTKSYFTWGNTEGHLPNGIDWCSQEYYNNTDGGKLTADFSITHDAARVNIGGYWRVPSYEDWKELIDYCVYLKKDESTDTWVPNEDATGNKSVVFGVARGIYLQRKKDNESDVYDESKRIFFTLSGYYNGSIQTKNNAVAYITPHIRYNSYGQAIEFFSTFIGQNSFSLNYHAIKRCWGCHIRPVI